MYIKALLVPMGRDMNVTIETAGTADIDITAVEGVAIVSQSLASSGVD